MIDVLEHFDDFRLGPAAAVEPDLARGNAVAVQDLVHFVRPEKHVGTRVVPDQETETVRMPLHLAGNQVELGDDANRIAAVAHDLAVALHGAEPALESFALAVGDAEQFFEFRIADRYALRVQRLEYHFPARHRFIVIAALARLKRIAAARGRTQEASGVWRGTLHTGGVLRGRSHARRFRGRGFFWLGYCTRATLQSRIVTRA